MTIGVFAPRNDILKIMQNVSMYLIDVVLIVILSGFVFHGLFNGLIRMIGSLVSLVAGILVASNYYLEAFSYTQSWFLGYDRFGKTLIFLVIFILVSRLIVFLFNFIEKAFHLISIIPFLSTANRMAGGFLGLIEGIIVVSLLVYFVINYTEAIPFIGERVDLYLADSRITPYLLKIARFMSPLIPELVNKFKEAL